MNKYELIEKMFEKLDVKYIDGEEIWNIINKDVTENITENGFHNLELGRFGGKRNLFFAGVDVHCEVNEKTGDSTLDIKLLHLQNNEKTIYVEDINTEESEEEPEM